MEIKAFEAPALYGDHHVSEVQRILRELPGVEEVYASSAFQVIEVTFDETKTTVDKIATCLEEAGYLGNVPMLTETGVAAYGREDGNSNFRHTAVYETVKKPSALLNTSRIRDAHYGHVQVWAPSKWMNNRGK
jgi:copper chaperone CopZ